MDCKVCRKDGNLQLLIDGEPQALSAYMTYNPRSEEYAAFAKAGIQIFSMGGLCGRSWDQQLQRNSSFS